MLFDFCSFTTATTGFGTITAGAAVSGFRTLATCNGGTFPPDGTLVEFTISDGVNKESCTGVTGGSGTTLTRVLSQSTTGALLNLSGSATVSLNPISSRFNALNAGTTSTVAGRVRRSTNQSIPAGASFTTMIFDTAPLQQGGTFFSAGAPTEIIIPEDGTYIFSQESTGAAGTVAVTWDIELRVGAAVIGTTSYTALANATAPLWANALRICTAGQKVTVAVRHSNATALDIMSEGDHSPDVWLAKQGGAKGDTGATGSADTRATFFETDFSHTNAVQNEFLLAIIGSGSTFTTVPLAARLGPNHPGVQLWRSGTTANSGVQCMTALGLFRIGGGERWDVNFATAPVFTTVTFRSGALDSATSTAPVDGVYFEMSTSGAIVGKCRSNSVESVTATLATLNLSTDYHGRIEVNAAGTSVQFTVYSDAGASLGAAALTTNIPTASGRELGWGSIATSNATVATEVLNIDRQRLTNPGRVVARGAD